MNLAFSETPKTGFLASRPICKRLTLSKGCDFYHVLQYDEHVHIFFSGYPAQDYINGIPRKTALCLSFSQEKFHNFMIAIYPKLEERMYDMYRIDKTRRLIRIEVKSPRELKDMKYQGSVIVIPYVSFVSASSGISHLI